MSKQANRDREGNLGQTGKVSETPAGTTGRQEQPQAPRPASRPKHYDDDEDSGLGNRTGLR
jgi:hypothetical protein